MSRQNNAEDEAKRMQLQFQIYFTVQKGKKLVTQQIQEEDKLTRIMTQCKTNELCEHIMSGSKERPFFLTPVSKLMYCQYKICKFKLKNRQNAK